MSTSPSVCSPLFSLSAKVLQQLYLIICELASNSGPLDRSFLIKIYQNNQKPRGNLLVQISEYLSPGSVLGQRHTYLTSADANLVDENFNGILCLVLTCVIVIVCMIVVRCNMKTPNEDEAKFKNPLKNINVIFVVAILTLCLNQVIGRLHSSNLNLERPSIEIIFCTKGLCAKKISCRLSLARCQSHRTSFFPLSSLALRQLPFSPPSWQPISR